MFMTMYNLSPPRLPMIHDQNRWLSIDSHFQDVVGRMCLFIVITKAADKSKIIRDVPMSIV